MIVAGTRQYNVILIDIEYNHVNVIFKYTLKRKLHTGFQTVQNKRRSRSALNHQLNNRNHM